MRLAVQMSGRRGQVGLALLVATIVAGVGIWAQNSSLVGVNYDDGIYALLARALARGEGYVLTFIPGTLPGVKYPPLYPLSLVPFWWLAGSQENALLAMKLANGLYIGIAAGLFAFMLADLRILNAPLSAIVAMLGFAAGSMMLIATGLLSEPLYLILLWLALWATDRLDDHATLAKVAAAGVLAALVALTRMVGIALVPAVLIVIGMRFGRRRLMVAAAAVVAVLGPWLVYSVGAAGRVPDYLVPHYGSYAQLYLSNVASSPLAALEIFYTNTGAILQTLGSKLFPGFGAIFQSSAGGVLLALSLAGSRRVFRHAPATAVYPWLYLALVAVWSFPPFRFVFVLFPLLLALAAVGMWRVAEWAGGADSTSRRARLRVAVIAVGFVVLANVGYREARSVHRRVWDGSQMLKSAVGGEVIEWVRGNTDRDAVVAFEFDPLIALHTGRYAVPNNYEAVHPGDRRGAPPVEPLARLLRETGVDYLAVRRDIPAAAQPIDALLGRYPESLTLQYVTPMGALIFEADPAALAAVADAEPGSPQPASNGTTGLSN
jgi:hypothetical protein